MIAEDAIADEERVRLMGGHPTRRIDVWSDFLNEATCGLERLHEPRVLKRSPDVEVVQTSLVDGSNRLPVIVKRYCEQRRRGWRRWVLTSLACADFRSLLRLRARGISVPRPLAYVGARGSSAYSWLVTEFVDGLVELEQIVLTLLPQLPQAKLRAVKVAVGSAVADLYVSFDRSGLHHRDLKASNVMLRHWEGRGGNPEAWIVDVEGFRGGNRFAASKRKQRLIRLAASLREYSFVTRSDYARFLRRYGAACGWTVTERRSMFRTVAQASRDYARRSSSRKQHKIDGYGG